MQRGGDATQHDAVYTGRQWSSLRQDQVVAKLLANLLGVHFGRRCRRRRPDREVQMTQQQKMDIIENKYVSNKTSTAMASMLVPPLIART